MWNKSQGCLVAVALAAALTTGCAGAEEPEPMMEPEAAAPAPMPGQPAAVMEAEVTLTGCLIESDGAYVLALTEASGDLARGTRFAVTPQASVSLAGHVTHTVRLTGTVTDGPHAMDVSAMQHVSAECDVPAVPGT